ncbi:4-alpha-glucanotransferase [Verticiella sediminum]|uniref:4-alpha-glucanotransferase n=1 Tax=Verticiella sediminum TaxID=1247510 RepID=A0A556AS97_9BURK|nr:4-alpha-glucanotransferase [Verticiella sediminum]TSH95796.1 4-alpha-glucanotransferase [Verticiella sediminum]
MNADDSLQALARAAGVHVHWHNARGQDQEVTPDVLRNVLGRLGLAADNPEAVRDSLARLRDEAGHCPPLLTVQAGQTVALRGDVAAGQPYAIDLEAGGQHSGHTESDGAHAWLRAPERIGYHRLYVGERELTLAVAPPRCTGVADLAGAPGRLWGLAVQLYSLRRRAGNAAQPGGVGDFTALRELAEELAGGGCEALAISPVHAMFSADPGKYSPYAPSSRLFVNAAYADPADVYARETIAAAAHRAHAEGLQALDAAELIDWPEVSRLRLALLRELYEGFPDNLADRQRTAFETFRREGGEALERHARFEALHAHQVRRQAHDWRRWEPGLRDPRSAEVEAFAQAHANEVRFHAFAQWLAHEGLAGAHRQALACGMRIGLMADLAVGTDPCGSHAWSRQDDVITGLSPGAPPDVYNPAGQAWGLTAFSPHALRRHGYGAYIEMLRAALAHAGGLRIDHALGMQRMWLVPEGAPPGAGAYVDYPFDDLMRLTALESVRQHAVIMGENLGTVPHGFNERIAAHGMLGMSVLWFEREGAPPARYTPPERWSPHSIGTTTTHDLPTVAGWWRGRDIDWRARLDLLGPTSEAEERQAREHDKAALWQAVRASDAPAQAPAEAPLEAAIAYVGRTAAPLVLLPLEDALGVVEQPNLPGTIDSHPNWRRRLPARVDDIGADARTQARLQTLSRARNA